VDADLIRLILLLLGIALVAGIWWWDRRQRQEDEPMAWREDEGPESIEDADEILGLKPVKKPPEDAREEPEPEPEALPAVELGEAERVAEPEPVSEPDATPPPLGSQPAWVAPKEPLIPAFVLDKGNEPAIEVAADTPSHTEVEVEAEPASELAWMPDSVSTTEFTPPLRDDSESLPTTESDFIAADGGLEPELPVLELEAEPIDAPAKPKKAKKKAKPDEPPVQDRPDPLSIRMEEDQFDLQLGFSAVDDQDLQEAAADLPELIVQINVVAKRGQPFTGEQILAAMEQVEMQPGEHDIFHRYDNRLRDKSGKHKILFSLASLVEPGNFPLKKMRDFSTPGMTLFAQLPGPRDGLVVYSDMLYVAERLARLLDARLKDENRSALTKQTIEHTRSRIAEHKRQITLKLRESNQNTRGRR
jgi:cell division protein ZipA